MVGLKLGLKLGFIVALLVGFRVVGFRDGGSVALADGLTVTIIVLFCKSFIGYGTDPFVLPHLPITKVLTPFLFP